MNQEEDISNGPSVSGDIPSSFIKEETIENDNTKLNWTGSNPESLKKKSAELL